VKLSNFWLSYSITWVHLRLLVLVVTVNMSACLMFARCRHKLRRKALMHYDSEGESAASPVKSSVDSQLLGLCFKKNNLVHVFAVCVHLDKSRFVMQPF